MMIYKTDNKQDETLCNTSNNRAQPTSAFEKLCLTCRRTPIDDHSVKLCIIFWEQLSLHLVKSNCFMRFQAEMTVDN